MNATALVIANDDFKRSQIIQRLSETRLFGRVKPLLSISSLLHHLKNQSADIICWAVDKEKSGWIDKAREIEQWDDLPLISFADSQQSLLEGFQYGACDSVNLSIDRDELSARLSSQLKRRKRLLELQRSKDQLQKMALTDPLTGLGNRGTFDTSLKQALARTRRAATPCSLMLIDLDYFKIFNDTYGHQAGDEVLQQVAKVLQHSARDADICCRYGGEEFAIILPDTEAINAKVLADRVHRQIARLSKRMRQYHQPLTVSIGISSALQAHNPTPEGIIEEADRALYRAKQNGRNRTETNSHERSQNHSKLNYAYPQNQQLAFGT